MNNMLADYIALKAKADQKRQPLEKAARRPARNAHLISHHFDCKDPWNWKFPQRSDTMSQSTLDEERDQVKLYSNRTIRTKRNNSLNLLSQDINGKWPHSLGNIVF